MAEEAGEVETAGCLLSGTMKRHGGPADACGAKRTARIVDHDAGGLAGAGMRRAARLCG